MPSLIILAAGMGSRYGGLKQLDPMGPNGETVLDYSVYDAIRGGFTKVIFVIRRDFAEAFKEGIGHRFADKIQVEYAYQRLDDLPEGFVPPRNRTRPWGTMHAIRAARHLVDGAFSVINADDFYGKDAYRKACEYLEKCQSDQCALIGYPLVNTLSDYGSVNRGICKVSPERMLLDVEEVVQISRKKSEEISGTGFDGNEKFLAKDSLASMNFWIFPKEFMAQMELGFIEFLKTKGNRVDSEYYIPTVVDQLVTQGKTRCEVLETSATWFGVTYPEDKPHVVSSIQALIVAGDYPTSLV